MKFSKKLGVLLLLLLSTQVQAVQTIEWDKYVIQLDLIVGVEQLIHFNGPATVGLPGQLANEDVFRHLFTSDTAYWKAMRPFSKQRVKVRLDQTGDFVLFDVTATTLRQPPKAVEPMAVVTPDPENNQSALVKDVEEGNEATMFDLLRYAVQMDYSPPRVVSDVRGVHAVENKVRSDLSPLYNHADNSKVDMFVKDIWGADGWYVTAIVVRNRTGSELTIDPSKMQHTARGVVNGVSNQFIASAMMKRVIGPRGAKTRPDSSMMYVITDRPFANVINL